MDTNDWSCPQADEHGFVAFDLLRERAQALDPKHFVEEFPAPALLTMFGSDPQGGEALDPNDSGVQLLTVSIRSTAILRYLGKAAFIAKRPGNLYAHLVSVGRSASNDVIVAVDSISKVHGYFVRSADGWSFTDHGSTNGSTLDGDALAKGDKRPLADGAILKLGLEATFEYVSPESLYQRALRD